MTTRVGGDASRRINIYVQSARSLLTGRCATRTCSCTIPAGSQRCFTPPSSPMLPAVSAATAATATARCRLTAMTSLPRQYLRAVRAAARAAARPRPRRLCSSPASSAPAPPLPPPRTADDIMAVSANKAFRYVFTRTLPLRSQPELSSPAAVDCVVADIEAAAARVVAAHAPRAADDRAAVHLHAAALAVAAHRALLPRLRDEARVMAMLRGAFGAGKDVAADARLPGHWVGKAALVFAPDRMAAVRRMTENAARDFGDAFVAERTDDDGGRRHVLTVSKCLYADVCREEGVPHLAHLFCALDRALFSHVSEAAHGVSYRFDESETLAASPDRHCTFAFEKVVKP